MYRFICSLLTMLLMLPAFAQDSTDVNAISLVKPEQRQLRIGMDLSRIVMNTLVDNRYSYEFLADYSLPKEVYAVLEAGFGGSDIDYPDLKYTSSNFFVKLGVDRSMLQRLFPSDWDQLIVGFRYGVGVINRSEAAYMTNDNLWGPTYGTIEGQSLTAHWAELTAGLRVELWKGLFAGYNIRGKFKINQGTFKELPPAYISGFGKGEKNTVFDFNFYLLYGLRW